MTGSPRRPRWPGADLPGRRIFVAVPLPPDANAAIVALVERIRSAGVPGGGRDVRWVRLDGLHLTLRFLGPTIDERIPGALEAVRRGAATAHPFEVTIGGAGVFPPHGRPRTLWLGLREGEDDMADLAGTVDAALVSAGWVFEPRPYSAHLTLARSDGVPAGMAIGAHLVAEAADMEVRFRVEQIGLFESITGGGPARYQSLELVDLG